jgi:hypothetical protein
MLPMSSKRKKPSGGSSGPRKPSRSGTPLHIWIDEDLAQALQGYLDSTDPRVAKTAFVESVLREALRVKGFWPHKLAGGVEGD